MNLVVTLISLPFVLQEVSPLTRTVVENCELFEDQLAKSALDRMRSFECKTYLQMQLSSLSSDYAAWTIREVDNSCRKYFDISDVNLPIGCFRDVKSNRLLSGFKYNLSDNNGPELCVQSCLRSGFPIAGVEFGVECFCGTASSQHRLVAEHSLDNNFCREYACPDKTPSCGGREAISVYRTGVKGKIEKKFPNFHPPIESIRHLAKVRILFLLQLNGRNSRQIRRLLRMIYSPSHLYFVHVDARLEFMQREMLNLQHHFERKGFSNFRVAKKRMTTIWGGSSLLELFLAAIADTTISGSGAWAEWDYVINLSETDMPLMSIGELEHNLERSNASSFLSSHGYNTARFLNKQGFHFHFMECESRMWRVAKRAGFPRNLRLDGGSDWVVIHRELAETILLPLESFFHTLSLNSGQFCERIFYRNLRFTNWNRKQGCRCEALKPVVDWCGCSPLALKASETEAKISAATCQSKAYFFGRKFDSLVDSDPIAYVERRVLANFRPNLIPDRENPSFNSTWLNLFSSSTRNDSVFAPINELLVEFSRTIAGGYAHPNQCDSQHLLRDVHVHKANSTAPLQSLFLVEMNCRQRPLVVEFLIGQKTAKTQLPVYDFGGFSFNTTKGIEFGLGFDVKEEVFRIYPPLTSTTSSFTFVWQWTPIGKRNESRWTSPTVELALYDEVGVLFDSVEVGQYDSINGLQYAHIQSSAGKRTQPGTHSAKLFAHREWGRDTVAEMRFPLFPDFPHNWPLDDFEQLVWTHFEVLDFCVASTDNSSAPHPKNYCSQSVWSSLFPDQKSMFP